MKQTQKFILAGAAAGFLNGLLGTGGGMVLVPGLRDFAGLDEKKSMATSVLCILPLSLLSALVYGLNGKLDFLAAWPYLAGGLAGGTLAGIFFKKAPSHWLRRGFGILLILGGLRMLFPG